MGEDAVAERSPSIRTAWHLAYVRLAPCAFPGYLIAAAVEAEFRGRLKRE